MKIAKIDSIVIKVPFAYGAAKGGPAPTTGEKNTILLVKVETDTGVTGWGDAFCYGCTDAVRAALHGMIAPAAIGRDAADIAKLSRDLQQKLHLFGRYGITIFALSGLDIALWDIAGKAANLPLHRLLGGAGQASLPAYASLLKYRDPAGLSPSQAARDGRGGGTRGARGRRPRRRDHGRHQLPVDAGRGAAHDLEAQAL